MRPADVDPQTMRDVDLLGTVLRERAHEWERVVEGERLDAVASGGEAPEHGDVELQAVVGNENVGTHKRVKLGEYFGKRRSGCDIGIGVAMHRRGLGGDWAVRIHQ